MSYFKVLVLKGHFGKGKSVEVPLFVKADSLIQAMIIAKQIPGIKHNKGVLNIHEITEAEYIDGREEQFYYKTMKVNFHEKIKVHN